MRPALWIGLAALIVAPAGVAPQDDPGVRASAQQAPKFLAGEARAAFLNQVSKKMGRLRSVAATFEQEKHLALFKKPLRSRGQILFGAPDHLRWEFLEPFRSVLIVSGDQVAKFEHKAAAWRKLEQGRQAQVILVVMDNIRSWFRGKFDAPRVGGQEPAFDVLVAEEPKRLIVMRPRDAVIARTLREVELALSADGAHVEQVTIREVSGDKTVMTIAHVERKPSDTLDTRYFSLEEVAEVRAAELRTIPAETSTPPAEGGDTR